MRPHRDLTLQERKRRRQQLVIGDDTRSSRRLEHMRTNDLQNDTRKGLSESAALHRQAEGSLKTINKNTVFIQGSATKRRRVPWIPPTNQKHAFSITSRVGRMRDRPHIISSRCRTLTNVGWHATAWRRPARSSLWMRSTVSLHK